MPLISSVIRSSSSVRQRDKSAMLFSEGFATIFNKSSIALNGMKLICGALNQRICFRASERRDLPAPFPHGINNTGHIVGSYADRIGRGHGFVLTQ